MKYLIFSLFFLISLGFSVSNRINEYSIDELSEFKTINIQFFDKSQKNLGKYHCLLLDQFKKTENDKILMEFYNETGKIVINPDDKYFSEVNFAPLIIFSKDNGAIGDTVTLRKLSSIADDNDFHILENELNSVVIKKYIIPEHINNDILKTGSLIYSNKNDVLKVFPNITKVIVYEQV